MTKYLNEVEKAELFSRLTGEFTEGGFENPDACLIWHSSRGTEGAGKIAYKGRLYSTHRLAWEKKHGEIPKGHHVKHNCGNKLCIRSSHLRLENHEKAMKTFKIERMYFNGYERELILTGLSESQARAFCRNKETSSSTCTLEENKRRTAERGPWFCGYSEET